MKESFWQTCSPGWSGALAAGLACPAIGFISDVYEASGKHKGLIGSAAWLIGVFALFFLLRSGIRSMEGRRGF